MAATVAASGAAWSQLTSRLLPSKSVPSAAAVAVKVTSSWSASLSPAALL
jgi:hypothetical protein